jgi:pyruvate/2-oxoglutarate dehydrogenase complex dihydrolipoamide acyltransferase (E2) component
VKDALEVKLAFLPGGEEEATVSCWKVEEGDTVEEGDRLVELTTGKSVYRVPAPCSGTIAEILVTEGDTVRLGEVLCVIEE